MLSVWESWITELVANYSIDGLRVDSAREVDTAFFPPFQSAGILNLPYTTAQTNILQLEYTSLEKSMMETQMSFVRSSNI